ncbi:MAG: response regulator [Candidatus Riflebacteria bacterium]|nr:response regulator [Candidatus Riflebacteria bacterium]
MGRRQAARRGWEPGRVALCLLALFTITGLPLAARPVATAAARPPRASPPRSGHPDQKAAIAADLLRQARQAHRAGDSAAAERLWLQASQFQPGLARPGWLDRPSVTRRPPSTAAELLARKKAEADQPDFYQEVLAFLEAHPLADDVRALALDLARRRGDAAAVAQQERLLGIVHPPPPRPGLPGWAWALALSLGLGGFWWWRRRRKAALEDGPAGVFRVPVPSGPDGAPAPTASWAQDVGNRLGVQAPGASGYIAAMNLADALKALFASGAPAARFFQTLMNESPVWMSLFSPDGRLVTINPAGLRVVGRREGDVLGLTLAELLPGSEVPEFRALFPAGSATGRVTFPLTIRTEGRADQPFEVALQAIAEAQEAGLPPGYLGLFQPAVPLGGRLERPAPRPVALPALEADGAAPALPSSASTPPPARAPASGSERRFRAVVEAAPSWISLFTLAGEVVTLNPAGQTLLGCSEDWAVGKAVWTLFSPDMGDRLRDCFQTLPVTREARTELTLEVPGGQRQVLEAVFTLLDEPGDDGGRRCSGIFTDVTARRKAEDALDHSLEHYENMVAERTAALTKANESLQAELAAARRDREQLDALVRERTAELARVNANLQAELAARRDMEDVVRQAREGVEVAARARQFLSSINQEIRAPLTSLLGYSNLLLGSGLEARQREYAETLQGSGRQLLSRFDELVGVAQMEAGTFALEEAVFDLGAMVRDCLDLVRPRAAEKGLDLRLIYEPRAPRQVVGDPGRLSQVFLALLRNAVEYTRQGRVTIAAKYLPDEGGRGLLRASIEDTGAGIPADRIGPLFQKPAPGEGPARSARATGLGLPVCKQLIEKMGGSMGVWSTPDVGSTFFFFVPLGLSDQPVAAEPAAPPAPTRASPHAEPAPVPPAPPSVPGLPPADLAPDPTAPPTFASTEPLLEPSLPADPGSGDGPEPETSFAPAPPAPWSSPREAAGPFSGGVPDAAPAWPPEPPPESVAIPSQPLPPAGADDLHGGSVPAPSSREDATLWPASSSEEAFPVGPNPLGEPASSPGPSPNEEPASPVEPVAAIEPRSAVESGFAVQQEPLAQPPSQIDAPPGIDQAAAIEPAAVVEPAVAIEPAAVVEPPASIEPASTVEPVPADDPAFLAGSSSTVESPVSAEPASAVEPAMPPGGETEAFQGPLSEGETFTGAALPDGSGAGASVPMPAADATSPSSPAVAGRHAVLVVEDDPATRDQLVRQLEELVGRVTCADSGPAALEACRLGRFDLILVQIRLKEMDGLEVTRTLRSRGGWHLTVPVVAVALLPGRGDRQRCFEAGMDDFLSPPFEPAKFQRLVQRHLGPSARPGL